MATIGVFLGTGLLTVGVLVFLYAVIPHVAWMGLICISLGMFVLFEFSKERISKHGLQPYLPTFINDFLTRTDIVEAFVMKLRENGLLLKVARLMIVKWIDLSRDEIVDVLTGVWPAFRGLSHRGTLLNMAPSWFQRVYAPVTKREVEEEFSLEVTTQVEPQVSEKLNIVPLLLWVAESRVRSGLSRGLPVARRGLMKTLVPALVLVVMWRRFPRSRKPLGTVFSLFIFLYVLSITKGLPASAERVLLRLGLTLFRHRNERPFATDHRSGTLRAVLYAMAEPFIPVINGEPVRACKVPNSPAWSQASTEAQL